MSEMKRSDIKYRNSHVSYVKELFKDIPKSRGRLVAISNGGYNVSFVDMPKFGFRVYFDKVNNVYNCQVYSEIMAKNKNIEPLIKYAVNPDKDTTLDTVINAILYNEYRRREWQREIRRRIKTAMVDLLQNNCICDYLISLKDKTIFLKNTYALDAYMEAYNLSAAGDVECYMAPGGKRALNPIFTVLNGKVRLSSHLI